MQKLKSYYFYNLYKKKFCLVNFSEKSVNTMKSLKQGEGGKSEICQMISKYFLTSFYKNRRTLASLLQKNLQLYSA